MFVWMQKGEAMKLTVREIACLCIGLAAGSAVTIVAMALCRMAKSDKYSEQESEEHPEEPEPENEIEDRPEETILPSEDILPKDDKEDDSQQQEAISYIDGLIEIEDIFLVSEQRYYETVMARTSRRGRPSEWSYDSYIYLSSTGELYSNEEEWPCPEKMSFADKADVYDRLDEAGYAIFRAHERKNLFFIDTRPESLGLITVKVFEDDFSRDDYIEYCKEFIDDPADWYARYGLEYGEVENGIGVG
jgi:hypothetical protein